MKEQDLTPEVEDLAKPAKSKKKPRKLLKVFAAIVVGAVLLIGGGIFLIFSSTNSSVEAAENFTTALFAKDYQAAYSYFHPSLAETQNYDQFEAQFINAPFDESCTFGVTGRSIETDTNAGTVKTVIGDLVCGEESFPAEMQFVEVDGEEKMIVYQLN